MGLYLFDRSIRAGEAKGNPFFLFPFIVDQALWNLKVRV